ncbi:MAG: helix-turn-helix domain-containing protein [Pseudonocardiaceae bacterium]
MAVDDALPIGARLRQLRKTRRKSLEVIAGLAGMSAPTLSRIERGLQALDSITQIVGLAEALQIAPSELMQLPVPAPANGHTDAATEAVRLVLDAVDVDRPGGLVVPVEVLRGRIAQIHQQRRACQAADVATTLPGLIRDLHTTLGTGRDHDELLELAVYLHVHVTRWWLIEAAGAADLLRRAVFLARRLAQERDDVATLAFASFGVADVLLSGGAFELGQAELDSITLPPTAADNAGLVGQVTALHAVSAALNGRPGEVDAPLDAAAELAERFGATGETDSLGYVFGPPDAGLCRMARALEAGEPDRAVRIAQQVHPERHPFPVNQSHYWAQYGRVLARLRRRHDDAVAALRTAEDIFPAKVLRDPILRDVIAGLLARSRRDSPMDRQLRGMAYRAGLLA